MQNFEFSWRDAEKAFESAKKIKKFVLEKIDGGKLKLR